MKKKKQEPDKSMYIDPDDDLMNIASATECTGLVPAAVLDEDQAESYSSLYNIHQPKPEKQLRDGNPNNG